MAAKLANRKTSAPKVEKYVTVKVYEMHKKPNGAWGMRTRWEKRERETGIDLK